MRIYLLIFGILSFAMSLGHGQSVSTDSISTHGKKLISDRNLQIRLTSFEYLNDFVGVWMTEKLRENKSLPDVGGLAIQQDTIQGLYIITYQLYRDTSTYEYGGWLYSRTIDQPVFLNDSSREFEEDSDLEFSTLNPDYWYGMLYYGIYPLKITPDKKIYLLFGLDNYHLFTKRKIMDVLVIEDGKIHFGEPIIEMDADLPKEYRKNRFILDYSVQGPPALRYDEVHQKIIFDHLIFMKSEYKEEKIMRVPDGTYSGFEIDRNEPRLTFIEKVFHEVMEEAPGGRPKPTVKRNILGDPIKD